MRIPGILLIILLIFFGYRYYKLSPPDDILERLEEIRKEFKKVYDKTDGDDVVVVDALFLRPDTLFKSDAKEVLSLMDQIGAYKTIGGCNNAECSVNVHVGKLSWLSWIGSVKYYNHSIDGIVEEEIVDNINEAIETRENKQHPYAYCEKTKMNNWFYCKNNH